MEAHLLMDTSVILYDQSEKKGICILHTAVISMKYRMKGKEIQVLPEQVKVQSKIHWLSCGKACQG